MRPILAAADPTAAYVLVGVTVFFLWILLASVRRQKQQVLRMDQAMAQNRESLEMSRRSVELAEHRLAAQDETNRLLERLIETSSRRDRV